MIGSCAGRLIMGTSELYKHGKYEGHGETDREIVILTNCY